MPIKIEINLLTILVIIRRTILIYCRSISTASRMQFCGNISIKVQLKTDKDLLHISNFYLSAQKYSK